MTTKEGLRANIKLLWEDGASERQISAKLRMPKSTVHDIIQLIKDTGSTAPRKRFGKARITSKQTDNMIRRAAVRDPTISSTQIRADLPNDVTVSTRTIRRRLLKDAGLRSRRPALKPRLSLKNIRDRIAFCRAHRHWSITKWRQVMFSDETQIKQFAPHKSLVRRPPNQRFNARYTVPAVKQCPSIMVWGAIASSGRCGIYLMQKGQTVNSQQYLKILQEKVPNLMEIRRCKIFQHDGAPCHQSRLVKSWLEDHNVQVLGPWPGSSPDLNPIENCWVKLKSAVSRTNPTSLDDLAHKIRQAWITEITPEYCQALVDSMPDRINAVLKAHGGATKY
jgi:transposase